MLRRFFYAAAGLFLLALAYQLGAGSANAQAPGARVVGDNLAVSGGQLYQLVGGIGWERITNVPVAPDLIDHAYAPLRGQLVAVISTTGDGYGWADAAGWANYGQAPGGATPAVRQTWGEVKARYR